MLTNDIISFEQVGLVCYVFMCQKTAGQVANSVGPDQM